MRMIVDRKSASGGDNVSYSLPEFRERPRVCEPKEKVTGQIIKFVRRVPAGQPLIRKDIVERLAKKRPKNEDQMTLKFKGELR